MCNILLRWAALRSYLVCALICLFAIGPASVFASAPSNPQGRLILRLHDDPIVHPASGQAHATEARLKAILRSLHIEGVALERSVDASLVVMRFTAPVTAEQIATIADRLESSSEVMYAEPDAWVKPAYMPSDPLSELTKQWFHYETYGIRAYEAWDLARGSAGVVIALLDTGIRTHEDLDPARVLPGYDFISSFISPNIANDGDGRDADPADPGDHVAADECGAGEPAEDSSWHGLHLAGIMTATADNAVGGAGINHVSRLLPVRVLGKCGGSFSDILDAILWSAGLPVSGVPTNTTPAKVINLSFAGAGACSAAVQDAINRAVSAGSIVVAAAGNENGTDIANVFPAGCDNVIAVAATDRSGAVASYSNIGNKVLLSAPGGGGVFADGIYSTYNSGLTSPGADSYTYLTGTSVATAQVSAAVSLILSIKPTLTLSDIRQILIQTAQPYTGGCPGSCGAGRLDMFAALQLAQTTTPSSPPAAAQASGGGGGGCVLRPGQTRTADAGWGLVALVLGGLWLRNQSMRV